MVSGSNSNPNRSNRTATPPTLRWLPAILALSLVWTVPAPSQQTAGQTRTDSSKSLPPPPSSNQPASKKKKAKAVYTGPNTVVELPPAPVLDAEGRQLLDPDAKPIFSPAMRQMRDKKGHPVFDEQGKPVFQTAADMGYNEKGKKIRSHKEKKVKLISVTIERGTLTVDGMTGKAALNYQIADLKYLYLYAPGIGTVIVSPTPFPYAKEQPRAFDGNNLTVTVGEHVLQVSSENRLLGKKPQSAFVLVDRDFQLPSTFPAMGYGPIRKPPYAWPGSKPNPPLTSVVQPPPLPPQLVPAQLLAPCPAGQMRVAAAPASKAHAAKGTDAKGTDPQPCVPIAKAAPAAAPPAPPSH